MSGDKLGEVNTGQRREINTGYFAALGRAKIIVTCNPSNWEGDFRLWEALSSGALVFIDEMSTPMPHAPRDGEHIVVYDNVRPLDRVIINMYMCRGKKKSMVMVCSH